MGTKGQLVDENWVEFHKNLYGFTLKRMSDNDLETWIAYVSRETVEAKLEKKGQETKDSLAAWYKVLLEERERRSMLAKHGATKYKGEDKTDNVGHIIAEIKRYYTEDMFVALFQEITGFDVFPSGSGRFKYRCTIHGQDNEPSGVLYLREGRYYCFGCSVGGDIFQLMMTFRQLTFMESVDELSSKIPQYVKTKEGKWQRM